MSPKKQTEDIIVPTRKNRLPRKDITISLSAKKKETSETPVPKTSSYGTKATVPLWFGVSLIGLVLLLGGGAWYFGGVTVEVAAREESKPFAGTFVAYAEDNVPVSSDEVLTYRNQVFSREASEVVPATERKKVEERATGSIVVYNEFSSASQRLIKNTRFEAPDGHIFRIDTSVDVPGTKTVNGKVVPGQVEVTVFADEPGDAYNVDLVDFTIPGFKGKPQYTKFYAKSKTPMTGGFSGERLVADEAEVEAAQGRLRAKIETELKSAVSTEAPARSILLKTYPVNYQSGQTTETSNGVQLTETGTETASFVDHAAFAAIVARTVLTDYNGEPILFKEPLSFSPSITSGGSTTTAENEEVDTTKLPLNVGINGSVSFVWKYDPEIIKKDLAGVPSVEMNTILNSKHPGVAEAKAKFRPFCIRCVFPSDPKDIQVVALGDTQKAKDPSGI